MTKPLRNLHAIMIACLAIPTLILFILSINGRYTIPESELSEKENEVLSKLEYLTTNNDLFDPLKINLVFYRNYSRSNHFIHLKMNDHLIYPDILVYMASNSISENNTIPEESILLGQLSYQSINLFELPELNSQATIILYSLGQQIIISSLIFNTDDLYQSRDVN